MPSVIGNPALPVTKIPVTWGSLNLTGKLVYTITDQQTNAISIRALDLANGEISTVFQAPENSWVYFSAVSPDNQQLVIAYSAPASNVSDSRPALYLLPLDGSTPPKLLFTPPSDLDEYNQPCWSADGKYVYFFHITLTPLTSKGQQVASVGLERVAYPGGQPEKIMASAFWPRISSDSKQLVYVSIDPTNGKNKLFLANMDGSNSQEVVMSGNKPPDIIDAPLFSPDGKSILFSAIVPVQASAPTWLEKLFGVTVASAHTVPSEWWSVPLSGGVPNQLTHIQTTGLYASVSPDGKYIASTSGMGLFVMHPDGSDLTILIDNSGGDFATLSWIP
jgi:Tol biopolymer transport system component